ncbi:MAG TPA: hypothetical protein VMH86_02960 [Rhizomicrobium sp.]|nr:hypothetical protein [Rhizomicrobium sp.]
MRAMPQPCGSVGATAGEFWVLKNLLQRRAALPAAAAHPPNAGAHF